MPNHIRGRPSGTRATGGNQSAAGMQPRLFPAWYTWRDGTTGFAFRSTDGTFTAHKEYRSPTQL
jgi:hypothetical protein